MTCSDSVFDAAPKWETQFYPADQSWTVNDGPLEVFGTGTVASFDTQEDAERFAKALNDWERNKKPPQPEAFNGERGYGRRCCVPGCGSHISKDNIKCGEHGGAEC